MKPAKNTQHSWSEDRLQSEVIYWFNQNYLEYDKLLFSVPNGGNRDGATAKRMKATGAKSGVADLLLMVFGSVFCIELKRPDGKGAQSLNQKEWEKLVQIQGFEYVIFNDLEEIKTYINKKMELVV